MVCSEHEKKEQNFWKRRPFQAERPPWALSYLLVDEHFLHRIIQGNVLFAVS